MDAVVVNVNPPTPRFHLPRIPGLGPNGTKVISVFAAVVICLSMIVFAIFLY